MARNAAEVIADYRASTSRQRLRYKTADKAVRHAHKIMVILGALDSVKDCNEWAPSIEAKYLNGDKTGGGITLTYFLDENKRASSFVRDAVKALGRPARKVKSYDERISAFIQLGDVEVIIGGYQPETCVLTKEIVKTPVDTAGITCVHCGVSLADALNGSESCLIADQGDTTSRAHEWARNEERTKLVCTPQETDG